MTRVAFARGVVFASAVAAIFALIRHRSRWCRRSLGARNRWSCRHLPRAGRGLALALARGLWLHLAGCVIAVTSVGAVS
jgi:hypothetical protein